MSNSFEFNLIARFHIFIAELYAFRSCGGGGVWLDNITNYNACIAFLTQYHEVSYGDNYRNYDILHNYLCYPICL